MRPPTNSPASWCDFKMPSNIERRASSTTAVVGGGAVLGGADTDDGTVVSDAELLGGRGACSREQHEAGCETGSDSVGVARS